MSSSNAITSGSKPVRGRRAAEKVPCDRCIERATGGVNGNIELCESCTAVLLRPRKSQQGGMTNLQNMRRQSFVAAAAAVRIRTNQSLLPWSSDRQEQHAVNFFVEHSSRELAGYFDSPFWQRMVLVAARHEPCILHAIAAIGALHEKLITGAISPGEPRDRRTRFALEQCNKSIQHLIKPTETDQRPDLRLLLTACVLFTCFEALQGNCEQAATHATQGYNLLQQYARDPGNQCWDGGAFAVELDCLRVLMRRLQTQSKGLMGMEFHNASNKELLKIEKPNVFEDLREARASLEQMINQLTVFFLDLELPDDQFYDIAVTSGEKHLLFTPWLQAWEKAFSDLLARTHTRMGSEARKAAMILKAHHLLLQIVTDVDLSCGELGWDAFHDQFRAIVDLATAVLEDTKRSDTSITEARGKQSGVFKSSPSATLSFSLGIVDPLYEVVARCRDPVLRRRALDLLATHPHQDCLWSSWSAWKVGKFLMRLEEEGTGSQPTQSSDIPAERRISAAWLDFSDKSIEEQQAEPRVAYKRAVPYASARYALNPGLFDWRSDNLDFTTVASPKLAGEKIPATGP